MNSALPTRETVSMTKSLTALFDCCRGAPQVASSPKRSTAPTTASSISNSSESESLMFDNGRLKTGKLQHRPGFRPARRGRRSDRLCAFERTVGSGAAARGRCGLGRQSAAIPARYAEAPPRTNRHLYSDENPIGSPSFEAKAKLLQEIDAYLRAKDPRVRQVTASLAAVLAACRNPARRRPAWCATSGRWCGINISVVVGDGDRQETRLLRHGRAQGLSANSSSRTAGSTRADEALRQALVNLEAIPAPAGTFDIVLVQRLAGRDAARGRRPRAGRRFQPQEDLGLRRPDGPAGRRQGRHRRRRRHDRASGAAR